MAKGESLDLDLRPKQTFRHPGIVPVKLKPLVVNNGKGALLNIQQCATLWVTNHASDRTAHNAEPTLNPPNDGRCRYEIPWLR